MGIAALGRGDVLGVSLLLLPTVENETPRAGTGVAGLL
jgi:hypothetical protein